MQAYRLHLMAKAYGTRPSNFINGEWLDFQFDAAIFGYGSQVDAKLDERDKDGKRKHSLEEALKLDQKQGNMTELFLASGQDEMRI